VLQWWGYGINAKQTYESCVDFAVAAPACYEQVVVVGLKSGETVVGVRTLKKTQNFATSYR
jgi:hypothetical protein